MRPRFQINEGKPGDNSMLRSLQRGQWAKQLRDEKRKRHEVDRGEGHKYKHAWDMRDSTADFLKAEDDHISGITELAVVKNVNGKKEIDERVNAPIVIGGKEHQMSGGTCRIISKDAVDTALIPILEEREFKDSIMSAILSDRSGRICRLMLGKADYDALEPSPAGNTRLGVITGAGSRLPKDILEADGRPQMFMYYHESSKEWATSVHRLSLVIDNAPLIYDGDIGDWLHKYEKARSTRGN